MKASFLDFKEVNKVMEFLLTMTAITLVFVAATIAVALLAGGLVKLNGMTLKHNIENMSPGQ